MSLPTDPNDPTLNGAPPGQQDAPSMGGMNGTSPGAPIDPQPEPLNGQNAASSSTNAGMNFMLDVPVEVTIELGRRNMRIADVLRLGQGSTLELDKVSGDPLDVYVNNQLIARGEAVVIGERYGVRLTEVLVNEIKGTP